MPSMFCNHKWEVKVDKILPSPLQDAVASGANKFDGMPKWFFDKTHIVIMVCSECGEIDKTITNS